MHSFGKDAMVNFCSHSVHSQNYYFPSRACLLGFPTYSCPDQVAPMGTIGSCLKALQLAAGSRSDMPGAAGLSRVCAGKPPLSRVFQTAPCSRTFLQVFQGFGSLLGQS